MHTPLRRLVRFAISYRLPALALLFALIVPLFAASSAGAQSTTYVYDAVSHALSSTFTVPGKVFFTVYDSAQNDIVLGGDQSSVTSIYTYDYGTVPSRYSLSNPPVTVPGAAVDGVYDSVNNLVQVATYDQGITTTYTYEPTFNHLATVTEPITAPGDASSTLYDGLDRQINVLEDAGGNTTVYTYDAQSRTLQSSQDITVPGNVTQSTYDSANNQMLLSEDRLGNVTTYTYDGLSRQVQPSLEITTPGDHVTTSFYDSQNRIIGIGTEANGVNTIYLYDAGTHASVGQFNVPGPVSAAVYDPATNQYLISTVPEPSTISLTGLALLAGCWAMYRRCR